MEAGVVLGSFVAFSAAAGALMLVWRSLDDHSACPVHCPHREVRVAKRR